MQSRMGLILCINHGWNHLPLNILQFQLSRKPREQFLLFQPLRRGEFMYVVTPSPHLEKQQMDMKEEPLRFESC